MFLYRLLSILLFPIFYIYILIRLYKGKESKSRLEERFGFSVKTRPECDIFWIHCVSVGESNSALSLIDEILESNPKIKILFTSTTVTSANQIADKIGHKSRIIHQFLPIDDFFSVNRFLNYWKPKFAIFIESEIWPNLINLSAKKGIRLFLINARISAKSAKRWSKFHKIGFNILKNFEMVFAQSLIDQKRFTDLGLENVKFLGNLKACGAPLKFDKKELEIISQEINHRKFWLASSTHKGEEEIIFKTHQALKEIYPDILTIIAPRHPNRMNEILKIIPNNLNYSLRSKNNKITNKTDIYFVDSLGELGLFYKLSPISLIAGSLIDNIGGHTPFEALKLGSVVISGKFVANNQEIYNYLQKNRCALIVKNSKELLESIKNLLQDKSIVHQYQTNWMLLEKENKDMLRKIVNYLK